MTWLDDLQRRLAIAGAKSLGHEFADHVGRTFRGEQRDVWETATNEPPDAAAGTAPECAWCPVCRAIRMARDSRPDLAARVGETVAALMSAAQDAVSAIDAALSRLPAPAPGEQAPAHDELAAATPPAAAAGAGEPGATASTAAAPAAAEPTATAGDRHDLPPGAGSGQDGARR